MTVERITWFKRNGISLTTLLLVVGLIVKQASWQERVDNKLSEFEKHTESDAQHIPFEQMMLLFVPRNENNEMKKGIDMINAKVDLLLSNELKRK
jgi:hypothetical protein